MSCSKWLRLENRWDYELDSKHCRCVVDECIADNHSPLYFVGDEAHEKKMNIADWVVDSGGFIIKIWEAYAMWIVIIGVAIIFWVAFKT